MRNVQQLFPVNAGVLLTLAVFYMTSVSGRELHLPFVLTNNTCNFPDHFAPVCTCITENNISNFDSLCRSYEEFSRCLELQLFKGGSSFLDSVYPKQLQQFLVKDRLAHVCQRFEDIRSDMESCSYKKHTSHCDVVFARAIMGLNGTFSEADACKLTELYGDCYWAVQCPSKVKHLLTSMAQFYYPYTCAKHGRAVSRTCVRLTNALYPDAKKLRQQCMGSVYTQKECFEQEHLFDSDHPEDRLATIDLKLDRQEDYGRFRCEIQEERDHQCSSTKIKEQKACFISFHKDLKTLESQISTVTTQDICRVYNNVTRCMITLFRECPVESVYFNSILCAGMPSSCYCPVDLVAERAARSSLSRPVPSTNYLTILCTLMVIWLWYA